MTDAAEDVVALRARYALERFSPEDRARTTDALEAAGSELQRELLLRAVAAGNTPSRLIAFAAALRPLPDEEAMRLCTLPEREGPPAPLGLRLKAMADPLTAYEAWGRGAFARELGSSPREPGGGGGGPNLGFAVASRELGESAGDSNRGGGGPDLGFGISAREMGARELGSSRESPPPAPRAAPGEGSFADDLMTQGTSVLGVSYREEAVDRGGLALAQALQRAAQALADGLPVPVILGARPGKYSRHALLLQMQSSGSSRVFQLHDPITTETVWVHERDFLAGSELPLSTATLRRITAIALPVRTP